MAPQARVGTGARRRAVFPLYARRWHGLPLLCAGDEGLPWTEQGRAYIAGVEELGVTYLGCFLHRAYFRWVDDGRPEEMFSDLASQAQEARCVRSAQIFAAALCALGAAMQFYTAWGVSVRGANL